MAFNKAKALQEAHKYVTQGKIARAIRQYEAIVEKDPGDLTLLNIIGDLHARDNNVPEALKHFYRLADAYTKEGYKVKAIAIYKKISKIDRDTAEPLIKLAELNAAQGLAREAREQYKNAFEFFERTNQKDKALGILRELCQLDPQSADSRLKLAQFAEHAGESREAADAYLETAMLSHQGGDIFAAESALQKAAELAPEDPKVHLYRARQALAQADSARGDASAAKRYHEESLELAQAATSAEAESFSSVGDVGPVQPASGSLEQPPASVEIDLSEWAEGQGTPEQDAQLPPPQEIPLEFQNFQEVDRAMDGISTPQGHYPGDRGSPGPEQAASVSDKASGFNYEESREEIEFYLRHGFNEAAREAVTELEKKFPGDSRVADLRERVVRLGRDSNAAEGFRPLTATSVTETREGEWGLPTSFSETVEVEGLVRESRLPAGAEQKLYDSADALSFHATEHVIDASPRSPQDASEELGSLLDELNEANEPIDQAADDDQTHYNLGVAFREMGLLDEAIGEFQKALNRGSAKGPGANFLQGCTLLAACFMEKGMPAIAARWYSRALEAPSLDREGMLALYYDLGIAFEKAGNTTAALEKFTEVYSQNIDYRDVAEKIRLLRQSAS